MVMNRIKQIKQEIANKKQELELLEQELKDLEAQDQIIEKVSDLDTGLMITKQVVDGRRVDLYTNEDSTFALRVQKDKNGFSVAVKVYVDGEEVATWKKPNSTWVRSLDGKRAKTIKGILNLSSKEGLF